MNDQRDDSIAYREYLQRTMISQGWEEILSSSEWRQIPANAAAIAAAARESFPELSEDLIEAATVAYENFQPDTLFEAPDSRAIFGPILAEIKKSALELGLPATRPITLATSTDISSTPLALPTTGDHTLFFGRGTSAFCNYWSKAITATVFAIASGEQSAVVDYGDFLGRVKSSPYGPVLASRLALYYGCFGTLLGFGKVFCPPEQQGYRAGMLRALEIFAVAHEYSHIVAFETNPEWREILSSTDNQNLEYFCDQLGMQLARLYGAREKNWFAFTGIGAIAMFHVAQLCKDSREALASAPALNLPSFGTGSSDSHPPLRDRVAGAINYIMQTTHPDEMEPVSAFLSEYDLILKSMCALALDAISNEQDSAIEA